MTEYKKYAKRIIKQYGKNIKAFEKRLDNPIITKNWEQLSKKYNIDRRVEIPYHVKKGVNRVGYEDLVKIANE